MSNVTFNAADLGFIAQVAYAESDSNELFFEHLMEIAVDFEDMATGRCPATWERVAGWLEYAGLEIAVMDDILALLMAVEEEQAA